MDNTLFSHAGLAKDFVETQLQDYINDYDFMLDIINGYGVEEMWEDNSPIWVRPQNDPGYDGMFPSDLFQVVGHTPVSEIFEQKNMITTDTFSTYSTGKLFWKSGILLGRYCRKNVGIFSINV